MGITRRIAIIEKRTISARGCSGFSSRGEIAESFSSRTALFENRDIGLIDYYYTKKNAQKQTV
jgi:hypothetical protein